MALNHSPEFNYFLYRYLLEIGNTPCNMFSLDLIHQATVKFIEGHPVTFSARLFPILMSGFRRIFKVALLR